MKLTISKSRNAVSYYVSESYRDVAGRSTTRTVEKLGTNIELQAKLGPDVDVEQWARDYVKKLNEKLKAKKPATVTLELPSNVSYGQYQKRSLNVGYLILRRVLHSLGVPQITADIAKRHRFRYDLDSILSDLVYSRILSPASKLSSYDYCCSRLLEEPNYELHDIYRALEVLEKEMAFIQSAIYKNSTKVLQRNTEVLYYDCTNYFFEISVEDGFRMFGHSKENRPNPIVQMGLFMDGSGLPLAFNISPGSRNEQITLIPLEEQILKDFELQGAELTICADAGLCSAANKSFNSRMNRNFIVIRPIKTMSKALQKWALDHGRSLITNPRRPDENFELVQREIRESCWKCDGIEGYFALDDLDETDEKLFDLVFYKEKYVILDEESGRTERLIITYSLKYKRFMQRKRERDLKRAWRLIAQKMLKQSDLKKGNDVTRYIKVKNKTADGQEAAVTTCEIDGEEIKRQMAYDGFYAVSTSFDMDQKSAKEIAEINRGRWEIEESFMLLKSEFRARPVYLRKEQRIIAHFLVCYLALLTARILENKLNAGREEPYTMGKILSALRSMEVTKLKQHYTGSFMTTELHHDLQELSGMKFDCELLTEGYMQKNIRQSKKFFRRPSGPPETLLHF